MRKTLPAILLISLFLGCHTKEVKQDRQTDKRPVSDSLQQQAVQRSCWPLPFSEMEYVELNYQDSAYDIIFYQYSSLTNDCKSIGYNYNKTFDTLRGGWIQSQFPLDLPQIFCSLDFAYKAAPNFTSDSLPAGWIGFFIFKNPGQPDRIFKFNLFITPEELSSFIYYLHTYTGGQPFRGNIKSVTCALIAKLKPLLPPGVQIRRPKQNKKRV